MDTFEERVKRTNLTKSNRLIAEYCLNNQSTVAFQSAAELAASIGVSDVSVIRFARALGYDGYVELKRAWQDELCRHIDAGTDNNLNPVAKFLTRKNYHHDSANFNIAYAEDIYFKLLHNTLSALTDTVVKQVCDIVATSRCKYVIGIRTRATAASSMATLLRMAVPGVELITTEDYLSYMRMIDFSAEDCIIFISFGRFSEFENSLLRLAKENGTKLIVITDRRASRAAQAADVLVYCEGDINLPFYSSVATVALGESLVSAIAERDWDSCRSRIEQSERYLNKTEPKK